MLDFLAKHWFPILCATLVAIIFLSVIIKQIKLYRRAHRKGVGAEIEKSASFKKYEVEEIDVDTLESKGKK